jgi:hypothetical protein
LFRPDTIEHAANSGRVWRFKTIKTQGTPDFTPDGLEKRDHVLNRYKQTGKSQVEMGGGSHAFYGDQGYSGDIRKAAFCFLEIS